MIPLSVSVMIPLSTSDVLWSPCSWNIMIPLSISEVWWSLCLQMKCHDHSVYQWSVMLTLSMKCHGLFFLAVKDKTSYGSPSGRPKFTQPTPSPEQPFSFLGQLAVIGTRQLFRSVRARVSLCCLWQYLADSEQCGMGLQGHLCDLGIQRN